MSHAPRTGLKSVFASLLGFALVIAPLAVLPAQANTAGTGVVINELYLNGGSSGATYLNKFVELYNPTGADIALTGMSLQYRSASGTASPTSVVALTGVIPSHKTYLVSGGSNASNGAALPTPDLVAPSMNMSGSGGQVFLSSQTTALTPGTGNMVGVAGIVDMVGYGTANSYETSAASAASVTTSINRAGGVDTDINSADFSTAAPTPTASGYVPPAPVDLGFKTIEEIQGTGDASPFAGDDTLSTKGIVTAAYQTGGFNGFYIQTPGTGGAIDMTNHTASDGLFVYSAGTGAVGDVEVGDFVEIHGSISEYYGLTQITPTDSSSVTVLTDTVAPVTPATIGWQTSETKRESLEGMLLAPQGSYTVSDTYSTNQYGEILLASGTSPLLQPTEVAAPGVAAYAAALAANKNISVTLDDGATTNFLSSANQGIPLPWVSNDHPVRVGEAVTFTSPMIFDFRNSAWKLQPTQQLTVANAATVQPATFADNRTAAPEDVGGEVKLATFNVLNYFTTLGEDVAGCTPYNDRDGNPITVKSCTTDNGPRGAWDAANLQRQQDKIVAAITALGADVVGLEEIEASTSVAGGGTDRDAALKSLVAALNAKAGSDVWSPVLSPATVPATEDVIRTAFIYRNATVEPVGASTILIGSAAFDNARDPLAQAFKAKGAPDADKFLAIVNHFKSKGSAGPLPGDEDINDGQGASNASRVAQAHALVDFADAMSTSADTDRVFLMGDFNSYTMEDPIAVLTDAGYIDQGSKTGEYTYSYGGSVGSLDHVFANTAADKTVNDVDIWNINSPESVALEYSRYNYNTTNFYRADMYRASDHDPLILGLNLTPNTKVDLNLLNINDFHGRIDSNTVKFAGTIEQLRAEYGDANSLLGSAGDNIGASLFASSSQKDKPTIDVLNALQLQSSVGNHEFDTGYADLTGEIASWTDWNYLGANVYFKGTTDPALQEYVVVDVAGVKVGVIGAVTQETPSLVTPSGIAMLDFGDPVDAVNRVAAQLSDGDESNGEADVIVAEYHEGASVGTAGGGTLENQVALGGAFAEIVNDTSSDVDVIFTGHTHQAYAWDAPIPGDSTHTRPVLQTGSYGANIGQVVLTFDTATDAVTGYTMRNVPRTTVDDATLVATYPRAATVKGIVDAAIAQAAVIGNVPVGSVTADITRAFAAGVEDRGAESTIGNLVANSLVASLGSADRGGAEIGIVNPGGLRADLLYGDDGVITYAEANAVLPFLNNLWTTTLTGAQFKQVLEEQWQRTADGVPLTSGRTFLNLGLSDNVTYTYDPNRAMDDRVTAIYIDGQPIDMTKDYRIGSFNFLLEGGDNFWEFKNGTDTKDSGLVDRDAWIDYITANSPLSPNFARHAVQVTDVTPGPVAPGDTVTLNVSKLDLTSLGSPANTELTLTWEGSSAVLGTVPVSGGAAAVSFTVPADASGSGTLVMTAAPSGTTVRVPINIETVPTFTSSTDLKLQGPIGLSWKMPQVKVTVSTDAGSAPTGQVIISVNGSAVTTESLTAEDKGKVKLALPKLPSGIYLVTAEFVPDAADVAGSTSAGKYLVVLF
ncbi:5'-nucleotidase [Cryobacterium mesophilum]|uniref:ExeM/NucH family extracellular endonuclease n=1 Tax=Terrimesophilobacter mesophilus TaxID=433647 RepID=A0A4R8VAU6_9MICO|nr:ExeM/NucH family extracellular endonuclease [Terrimesophilobacter mesophilus]MBB5633325.1 5'-nucleotidase [Terrimesophilobacter mesophilus]TFB80059.1 ExeM/NucH family extracellular endonuclease [Terrimesophilobacter mesophilus]